jgi:hypothetical protein
LRNFRTDMLKTSSSTVTPFRQAQYSTRGLRRAPPERRGSVRTGVAAELRSLSSRAYAAGAPAETQRRAGDPPTTDP